MTSLVGVPAEITAFFLCRFLFTEVAPPSGVYFTAFSDEEAQRKRVCVRVSLTLRILIRLTAACGLFLIPPLLYQ